MLRVDLLVIFASGRVLSQYVDVYLVLEFVIRVSLGR